jgi:hypothetical protein
MFVKVINGNLTDYTIRELKQENPNTSFPREISDELLAGFGVYRVYIPTAPDFDPDTQTRERTLSPTLVGDRWEHSWTVRDLTAEELAQEAQRKRAEMIVTPRQARLELSKRNLLTNIDTIIASLPAEQQELVQIEWEYAVSIERNSPWVIQLGSALGLDEEGLDELFKAAALL